MGYTKMMAVSRDAAVSVVASLPWYISSQVWPSPRAAVGRCVPRVQMNLLFDLSNRDCRSKSFAYFFDSSWLFLWCFEAIVFASSCGFGSTAEVGYGRSDGSVELMASTVNTMKSVGTPSKSYPARCFVIAASQARNSSMRHGSLPRHG